MSTTFIVPLNTDAHTTLESVRTQLEKSGGQLTGDHCSGSFSGSGVHGNYIVGTDGITVTITDKPFYIPMSTVRDKITEYFSAL